MTGHPNTPRGYFPDGAEPVPGSPHDRYVAERLSEVGQWGQRTLSEHVRRHAVERPAMAAYVEGESAVTWADFDAIAEHHARVLTSLELERGDRVGVLMTDGPLVHALYVAVERAGMIIVGIGPRAGQAEISHMLAKTDAQALITSEYVNKNDMRETVARLRAEGLALRHHLTVSDSAPMHVVVDGRLHDMDLPQVPRDRGRTVGEIFMLNSTSGTTGMPKCVVHNQNRWLYYHEQVLKSGSFSGADVFLSLIPAPFGFGLWTAHVTPIVLGVTTVVMSRFDAAEAVRLIEREQVTVLNCVSTQFIMMLNSGAMETTDTTSLRCMYTGGEAIPTDRSAAFEDSSGSQVLNFYGSNETGTLSYTTMDDDRPHRLTTGGRIIEEMHVRLFDDAEEDVTKQGGPGQAACRGPATSLGYYSDPEANNAAFTSDSWMLTGDICTIDAEGYLQVVDRKTDFIIRGGKNISAAAVEEQVGTHPAVSMVAAVAVPDPVFGERVCAVIVLRAGQQLDMESLQAHLAARGVSKEVWPERLYFVDSLPRGSGGKVSKSALKKELRTDGSSQL